MGKPAARQGDMTVHGGSIVVGCPTVLIGGMPAARVADMHTCPMQTPGTPPIPHVGGPILPPGAVTVLIGGMPAACVGDMATCVGPPDSIAPPGCPTVLIGPGGGGGGGGAGAGSGGGSGQAEAQSGTSGQGEGEEGEEEDHFLDVSFTDQGGFPLAGQGYTHTDTEGNTATGVLAGRIRNTGVATGSHEIALHSIVSAKWSTPDAQGGDTVQMLIETTGFEDGTHAEIEIMLRDFNRADRKIETKRGLQISGDKIEEDWIYSCPESDEEESQTHSRIRYSSPIYYFVVKIDGYTARSDILKYKDWIEIELLDNENNPIVDVEYEIHFSNGEIRRGVVGSNGKIREEHVPTATHEIRFPNNPELSNRIRENESTGE